jgi:DNA-binding NarL/FixJ family response regulator
MSYATSLMRTNATQLSKAELSVLCSLANGLQSKEIAVEMGRSKPTVELYVRTLFTKLRAKSRAHLVALALHQGLIGLQDIRALEMASWPSI